MTTLGMFALLTARKILGREVPAELGRAFIDATDDHLLNLDFTPYERRWFWQRVHNVLLMRRELGTPPTPKQMRKWMEESLDHPSNYDLDPFGDGQLYVEQAIRAIDKFADEDESEPREESDEIPFADLDDPEEDDDE